MSIAPLTNIDCILERRSSHNRVIERSDVKGRNERTTDKNVSRLISFELKSDL
jgi:hypothetical protein